eukprot:837141-Amphidinium_carterae.1
MAGTGNGDFTMVNGHHLTEESAAQLQQPRLKASTRAVPSTMPTVEQTMPRPSTAVNPVSLPDNRPTSSTAPIPTTMDTTQEVAAGTGDNTADVTMRAESISLSSRSSSTVSGETMMNIEQLIWNNL